MLIFSIFVSAFAELIEPILTRTRDLKRTAAGGGPPKSLRAIIFSLAANIRICLTFKSVASAALRTAQTSTCSKA